MRRSQPKRSWSEARAKVEAEGCRYYRSSLGCAGPVEAAHIIGREHDKKNGYKVLPDRVVGLCKIHHRQFDAHKLDLFWVLEPQEIAQAVEDAGSPALMLKRTLPLACKAFNARAAA